MGTTHIHIHVLINKISSAQTTGIINTSLLRFTQVGGDGSAGEVLGAWAEFNPQNPLERPDAVAIACGLSEGQRQQSWREARTYSMAAKQEKPCLKPGEAHHEDCLLTVRAHLGTQECTLTDTLSHTRARAQTLNKIFKTKADINGPAHTCNLSTQEEGGRLTSWDQPVLHNQTPERREQPKGPRHGPRVMKINYTHFAHWI